MALYYRKFYESAVDSVQDPDNPGNDLKQIEDDVLASHDEEVEAAKEGMMEGTYFKIKRQRRAKAARK